MTGWREDKELLLNSFNSVLQSNGTTSSSSHLSLQKHPNHLTKTHLNFSNIQRNHTPKDSEPAETKMLCWWRTYWHISERLIGIRTWRGAGWKMPSIKDVFKNLITNIVHIHFRKLRKHRGAQRRKSKPPLPSHLENIYFFIFYSYKWNR